MFRLINKVYTSKNINEKNVYEKWFWMTICRRKKMNFLSTDTYVRSSQWFMIQFGHSSDENKNENEIHTVFKKDRQTIKLCNNSCRNTVFSNLEKVFLLKISSTKSRLTFPDETVPVVDFSDKPGSNACVHNVFISACTSRGPQPKTASRRALGSLTKRAW